MVIAQSFQNYNISVLCTGLMKIIRISYLIYIINTSTWIFPWNIFSGMSY